MQKNLATIRTVLYQAIREDLFPQAENPFFKFKLSGGKRKVRRPLSIDEIHRLEDAELSGRQNDARNAFVFAFYEGGVRISDVNRRSLVHRHVRCWSQAPEPGLQAAREVRM